MLAMHSRLGYRDFSSRDLIYEFTSQYTALNRAAGVQVNRQLRCKLTAAPTRLQYVVSNTSLSDNSNTELAALSGTTSRAGIVIST